MERLKNYLRRLRHKKSILEPQANESGLRIISYEELTLSPNKGIIVISELEDFKFLLGEAEVMWASVDRTTFFLEGETHYYFYIGEELMKKVGLLVDKKKRRS